MTIFKFNTHSPTTLKYPRTPLFPKRAIWGHFPSGQPKVMLLCPAVTLILPSLHNRTMPLTHVRCPNATTLFLHSENIYFLLRCRLPSRWIHLPVWSLTSATCELYGESTSQRNLDSVASDPAVTRDWVFGRAGQGLHSLSCNLLPGPWPINVEWFDIV